MNELLLSVVLSVAPVDSVLCPAYPGDPENRPMLCWILSRLGVPPDRSAAATFGPFRPIPNGREVEVRWE